jgi:hypothetical protein
MAIVKEKSRLRYRRIEFPPQPGTQAAAVAPEFDPTISAHKFRRYADESKKSDWDERKVKRNCNFEP